MRSLYDISNDYTVVSRLYIGQEQDDERKKLLLTKIR